MNNRADPSSPLSDAGLVVITGASRGIGRALAQHYLAAGREVVAISRQIADQGAPHPRFTAFAADLSEPSGVAAAAAGILSLGRPVDILVNNAGIQQALDVTDGTDGARAAFAAAAIREIGLNLTAPLLLAQALIPSMQPGGTIVNVTSLVSRQPKPSAPVYSATKAALASLTLSLRRQVAPLGIRVIEAVPPLVDTDMTAGRGRGKLSAEAMAQAIADGVRAGRNLIAPGLSARVLLLNRIAPELVRRILSRS